MIPAMRFLFRVTLFVAALAPVFARGPLLEENQGQFIPGVSFLARSGAVSTAVTRTGMEFRGYQQSISLKFDQSGPLQCGASAPAVSEANYLAVTPALTHVPQYRTVTCRNVYPGIDWVMRATGTSLEHDWKIAPGADPSQVALLMDATSHAKQIPGGGLLLSSGDLAVTWKAPVTYQDIGGQRRLVETEYAIAGRRILLKVGSYRRDVPLVIDPVIDFSYVVNGNSDDRGLKVALDGSGNIYIAGLTLSSNFQTTPGAAIAQPQSVFNAGNYQTFVTKLAPDGATVVYSTYLGTTGSEYYSNYSPLDLRVDASGDVFLAANASSTTPLPGSGAPIEANGTVGVYKLSPSGDQILYATTVLPGFQYADPVALAIDGLGDAYVAIGTGTLGVSEIDPTGKVQILNFTISLNGTPDGQGLAEVALGPDGSIYLAGTTAGGTLATTPGAFMTTAVNPQDMHGYVIRMKADGSAPIYSTYVAGQLSDVLSALVVDSTGAAYVGGITYTDGTSPALPGAALGSTASQPARGFVFKLDPTGSTEVYSALLPNTAVAAVAVDSSGNAYAGGTNTSSGITLSKIDPTGTRLLYHSNIPAPAVEGNEALGIAVDSSGAAYLAGSIMSLHVDDLLQSNAMMPNAFLLKMDPTPDQCDLSLQVQPGQSFVPGQSLRFVFTIQNNGPAAAQDVILSAGSQTGYESICRTGGQGVCGTNPDSPWASFRSIAPGASETVEIDTSGSGNTDIVASATVFTLTSEVNLNNNFATTTASTQYVEYNITTYGASCTVTGTPAVFSSTFQNPCVFAVSPGSQFQVYFPSPQNYGTFESWSDGSTDNPRTFTAQPTSGGQYLSVTFTPLFTPYVAATSVTSSASYAANGVSPGELITLFGFNFGQGGPGQVENGRFTTNLAGTSVTFNGFPAPLVYANFGQINAIVPYEIAGQTSTTLSVQAASGSYNVTVPVVPAVPAVFTANASGIDQAAALNQDLSVNSPANPANPGDVIVLYGTGAGLVNQAPSDGSISSYPSAVPQLPITVNIGGSPAQVEYGADAPGLVSGVIQINAVIPAGVTASHHVPVTWSAGTYTSPAGVTIAVNDSPAPAPVIQPIAANLAQQPITVSPTHLPADSGSAKVIIYGTGFVSGMVAQWNGQPKSTLLLDSGRLQVSLTGADLESPQVGMLAVWDASQTNQISEASAVIVYLPLVNHGMVYDAMRDKIYVAVAAAQSPQGSSVAILNPETGRVEQSYPQTTEPTGVVLSGDNQYLYVAEGNTVQRIDLTSWTADLSIPLGQDSDFGTREVLSMVTLPGVNNSLAVSFTHPGLSPPYLGTGIFDNAQIRTTVTPGHDGPSYLLGGPDTGTLYGSDSGGTFYVLSLDTGGVTVAAQVSGLLGGDGDPVYSQGLIYGGIGSVIDPSTASVIGEYDNQGPPVPLPDLQQVLILGDIPPTGYNVFPQIPQLTLHAAAGGPRIWSISLPVVLNGSGGQVIRWGENGLAVREVEADTANVAPGVDLFRVNLDGN